jgi:hypothetical protein
MDFVTVLAPAQLIRAALPEVATLMAQAFEAAGDPPAPDSGLDQLGLRDGAEIVEDYLAHGEPGVALDHLLYMVREPGLPISDATYALIAEAGGKMSMEPALWEDLQPHR